MRVERRGAGTVEEVNMVRDGRGEGINIVGGW